MAPRWTRTAVRLGGLALGAVAAERLLARRIRNRHDPELDPLLSPPSDVGHLTVPTPDGGTLHLLERGEGRPVLLLHGITLNAELWSPQLHRLADDHRVLALDQRGHGRSTAGSDGYGMRQLGRDISTVLTALDLRDVLVVGHSMGGMAALDFAVHHPDVLRERVSGLGLVATSAATPVVPILAPRIAAAGAVLVDRLDAGRPVPSYRFSGNDLSLFLIRTVFGRNPSATAIEQVRASIERTDDDAILRSLAGIFREHDTTEHLDQVDLPTFVVVGTRDALTPVGFARIMAERLPDAELTVLPGVGHQIMQERPAAIDQLVRDLGVRAPVGAPTAATG